MVRSFPAGMGPGAVADAAGDGTSREGALPAAMGVRGAAVVDCECSSWNWRVFAAAISGVSFPSEELSSAVSWPILPRGGRASLLPSAGVVDAGSDGAAFPTLSGSTSGLVTDSLLPPKCIDPLVAAGVSEALV